MKFSRNFGNTFQWLAISAGGLLVSHLAAPGVMPELVPTKYLPFAMIALQVGQKLLQDRAWERNWDGTPAQHPAPPDPKRKRRT